MWPFHVDLKGQVGAVCPAVTNGGHMVSSELGQCPLYSRKREVIELRQLELRALGGCQPGVLSIKTIKKKCARPWSSEKHGL